MLKYKGTSTEIGILEKPAAPKYCLLSLGKSGGPETINAYEENKTNTQKNLSPNPEQNYIPSG